MYGLPSINFQALPIYQVFPGFIYPQLYYAGRILSSCLLPGCVLPVAFFQSHSSGVNLLDSVCIHSILSMWGSVGDLVWYGAVRAEVEVETGAA